MGWKQIGNHRYLYRSVRVGGRVRSEYVGRGETAELLSTLLDLERREAEAEREAERERREADRAEDAELEALVAEAVATARAAIQGAGFHEHRGQWRKRRVSQ